MGCIGSDQRHGGNLFIDGLRNQSIVVEGRPKCPAYLSPKCASSKLGLVMIEEWWGLNKSITLTADQFSAEGIVVIVPDLYRAKAADSRQDAEHKMSGLDFAGAIKDIAAAKAHLEKMGCEKVFITGFCMGGALTIATIANVPGFAAAFPFYGVPQGIQKMDLSKVNTTVYAFFGKKDSTKGFADEETANKLKASFEKNKKKIELTMYEKADHAFMNKDGPNYNPEVQQQAFKAVISKIKA